MKRREVIAGLAGATAEWPRAVSAQQPAMPVVGFLSSESPALFANFLGAFTHGLNEAGFVEGQNVAIEYRWAQGQNERLPILAAELVHRQVSVIAAPGSTPAALAAQRASATIPIVIFTGGDPVRAPVSHASALESAIAAMGREPNGGLVLMPDTFLLNHRAEVASLAARHGVPAIYPFRQFTEIGGLISYGNDGIDNYRRAAIYADRILDTRRILRRPAQKLGSHCTRRRPFREGHCPEGQCASVQ